MKIESMTMKEQIRMYEDIRKKFSNPNDAVLNALKPSKDKAYSITVNIFLSKEVSKNLIETINEIKAKCPSHEYYTERALHITLTPISILPKKFNKKLFQEYISKVESVLKNIHPFEVELRGLNFFPTTAYAQVFSQDNKLYTYEKLFEPLFGKGKLAFVPHSAIIGQYKDSPSSVYKEINKHSETYFGKMLVKKIEIVKWDLSNLDNLEIIKSFKLK